MDADRPAAVNTCPADLFLCEEGAHAVGFDRQKVLDHAHAIVGAVTFVQLIDACAWEFDTVHA